MTSDSLRAGSQHGPASELRVVLAVDRAAAQLNAEGLTTATGGLWSANNVGKAQKRIEAQQGQLR